MTLDDEDLDLKREDKTITASSGDNADTIDQMIQIFSSQLKKYIACMLRYRSKQEVIFSSKKPSPTAAE